MYGSGFPFLETIVAAFLAFSLGLFWYHPNVMGTRWLEARGKTKVDMTGGGGAKIIISLFLWLIASCFYSFLIIIMGLDVPAGLFALSCLLWVAFAMPPSLMGALYTGYNFEALSIDSSYQLAGYYVFALTHMIFTFI